MESNLVRIYVDGVFDLFHYGHARLFEQVKNIAKDVYLIVGVNKDEDVQKYKGMPIFTQEERIESIRHCKWVDQVMGEVPWVIDEMFMVDNNLDYVAHDGDLYPSGNVEDIYGVPKALGKFIATKRTEGISTTDIVARVLSQRG